MLVCLILVTLSLYVTQRTYSYSSDDVSWQTILLTWRPFSGQKAYVGAKDNFLVNVPFILFFDHIFKLGRTQLLVEAIFFALLNFILFYFAALYFLKKAKVTLNYFSLFPFIMLASFASGLASMFLNTNWRDYEVGVSFVFYMLAAKYYFDEIKLFASLKSIILTIIALCIGSLFTYSDPYFFYFTLLPIIGFFIVLYALKRISKYKMLVIVVFSFGALLTARVLTSILARVGLLAPRGSLSRTSLHNLPRTLNLVLQGLKDIFGLNSYHSIIFILLGGFTIFAVTIILGLTLFGHKIYATSQKIIETKVWERFFGLVTLYVLLAYIASDNGTPGSDRYLFLIVYLLTLLILINISRMRKIVRLSVTAVISLIVIANTLTLANQALNSGTRTKLVNTKNYQIIAVIKTLGLNKGYAEYWDGDINTYLSGDTINFLPVTCHEGKTQPLPLLVNGGSFTKKSGTTFFVIDPTHNNPSICSESQVVAQFGQPEKRIHVTNKLILVYGYDLYTRMPENV